jgi:hypothetical protein
MIADLARDRNGDINSDISQTAVSLPCSLMMPTSKLAALVQRNVKPVIRKL